MSDCQLALRRAPMATLYPHLKTEEVLDYCVVRDLGWEQAQYESCGVITTAQYDAAARALHEEMEAFYAADGV